MSAAQDRPAAQDFHADCANCFALCCVVPAFAASADLAIDKPAGQAGHNLQQDFRCGIHTRLRPSGSPAAPVATVSGLVRRFPRSPTPGRTGARLRNPPGRCSRSFR